MVVRSSYDRTEINNWTCVTSRWPFAWYGWEWRHPIQFPSDTTIRMVFCYAIRACGRYNAKWLNWNMYFLVQLLTFPCVWTLNNDCSSLKVTHESDQTCYIMLLSWIAYYVSYNWCYYLLTCASNRRNVLFYDSGPFLKCSPSITITLGQGSWHIVSKPCKDEPNICTCIQTCVGADSSPRLTGWRQGHAIPLFTCCKVCLIESRDQAWCYLLPLWHVHVWASEQWLWIFLNLAIHNECSWKLGVHPCILLD